MTRVVHTGDTHIGYRQYHSSARRQDFLDAFEEVIVDAINDDVDAVVHAGDLFHDTRPDLPDLLGTINILRKLKAASIPFLAIVGNHEGTPDRQWLDLLADLALATRLDASGTQIGEVTFYGLDYVPPAQRERLTYEFTPPDTDRAALVAHGLFEPFPHANWKTTRLLEMANIEFDVLLLGDNHIPGQAEIDGTWVTYCGSTERTSAAEREERGYNLVSFDEQIRIARRTLSTTRTFEFVEIELAGSEGEQYVIEEVLAREVKGAVVVVYLQGEGERITPATVESAISDAGALVVRLIDQRDQPDEERSVVQFVDPDRAIIERVDELGLTPAGRMVDAVIRDPDVPDSSVRERVQTQIETLLAEDVSAFEREQASAQTVSEDEKAEEKEAERQPDGQLSFGEFK